MREIIDASQEFNQKRDREVDNVDWLIKKFPKCKTDYNLLILSYWYNFCGLSKIITWEQFSKILRHNEFGNLTQIGGIERAFRQIENIEIPEETTEARQLQEVLYHERYAKKKETF